MEREFNGSNENRQISSYAQEIEYALIVQRMINAVKNDPQQMRATIYEFARTRLKIDTLGIEETEREQLLTSLETAIVGVERFSRREDIDYLPPPGAQAQIASFQAGAPAAAGEPLSLDDTYRAVIPADAEILVPKRRDARAKVASFGEARPGSIFTTVWRLCLVLLVAAGAASLAYVNLPQLRNTVLTPPTSSTAVQPRAMAPDGPDTSSSIPKQVVAAPNDPGFPVPSNYGVYVLNNQTLDELSALPVRVPDKRIAVSTPVDQPSLTSLPDGKARFILYRRDLVGNAPDRVEIRVVARVARTISFDVKGRPNISAVSGAWNIRNVSHELRVRPVAGNPEMLLVQSDKPDFTLPAGRYVLVLKDQGYDFTVAGKVVEASQCLERTDAANGSFYSECLTP